MNYSRVSEIFKIGVGPSSSHTMGPWRICGDAVQRLDEEGTLSHLKQLRVHLYGSLAKTGEGHCTPMGCIMGLMGYDIQKVDPDIINPLSEKVEQTGVMSLLNNKHSIAFKTSKDVVFHYDEVLDYHSNGIRIECQFDNAETKNYIYYSVGGGFFVRDETRLKPLASPIQYPHDYSYAKDFIETSKREGKTLYELILENELAVSDEATFKKNIDDVVAVMLSSTYRGTNMQGILPGSLKVKRRAYSINHSLLKGQSTHSMEEWHEHIKKDGLTNDFQRYIRWVSLFAISVNEENASVGKVVTAPTNGSSGTIPSVLHYYLYLMNPNAPKDIHRFISIASLIGSMFRHRATISAAEGGCQAEIGVSASMAAAALTDAMGGTIEQVFTAAEITIEHHLGMTCDPIGGLVQIPCIERNVMGAMKAITSADLALHQTTAYITLDEAIDVMWETSQAMSARFRETSEGGLALIQRNC